MNLSSFSVYLILGNVCLIIMVFFYLLLLLSFECIYELFVFLLDEMKIVVYF